MSVKVFIRENTEELPGNGGVLGLNYFERPDCPDTREDLEPWMLHLCELSDKINTHTCEFAIEDEGKVIGTGIITKCKEIHWNAERF